MDMVDLKLVQICQEMFAFVALVLKKKLFLTLNFQADF